VPIMVDNAAARLVSIVAKGGMIGPTMVPTCL
jgi:hypothetical protein